MRFGQSFKKLYSSKIDFTIPRSIVFSKIFFKIISTIGPINIPITPMNLKPVYIAINVNNGCTPIFLLTILGSKSCLTTDVKIYNPKIENPTEYSLFKNKISVHGIMTVPEPKDRKRVNKSNK